MIVWANRHGYNDYFYTNDYIESIFNGWFGSSVCFNIFGHDWFGAGNNRAYFYKIIYFKQKLKIFKLF